MYFSNIIRYYDYENIIWFSILIYTLSLGMIGIPRPFDVVYFTQHYSIWFSIYPHLLHVDIADSKQVILFIILWNWTFLIINYKLISLKCNLVESGCCATTQHTNHNLDPFICILQRCRISRDQHHKMDQQGTTNGHGLYINLTLGITKVQYIYHLLSFITYFDSHISQRIIGLFSIFKNLLILN